jgi:hypothetical protein
MHHIHCQLDPDARWKTSRMVSADCSGRIRADQGRHGQAFSQDSRGRSLTVAPERSVRSPDPCRLRGNIAADLRSRMVYRGRRARNALIGVYAGSARSRSRVRPEIRHQNQKTPGPKLRPGRFSESEVVVRGGVEPPTFRFSGGRSYQLSYLTEGADGTAAIPNAVLTGFEPATFTLTG